MSPFETSENLSFISFILILLFFKHSTTLLATVVGETAGAGGISYTVARRGIIGLSTTAKKSMRWSVVVSASVRWNMLMKC